MLCEKCKKKPVVRGVKQIKCRKCGKESLIASNHYSTVCNDCSEEMYVCVGCGKKHGVPFQNKVENIAWVGYDAEKHCGGCIFYFTTAFANPGGWCAKFPANQVNCGDGDVCPLWEDRKIARNEKIDWSFLGARAL